MGPDQPAASTAHPDERPLRRQNPRQSAQRAVPDRVDHEVVAPVRPGEVLRGVVDHVIGSDRPNQFYVARAADAGHLGGAERLRDLHGERTDTSGRAVDQYTLPRLEAAEITQALKGREAGHRHGRGFLERHAGGFQRQGLLRDDHVLGARPRSLGPIDLVAGAEPRHALAHGLDHSGDIGTQDGRAARFADAHPHHRAEEQRFTAQEVPVIGIKADRASPNQDLVLQCRRPFDLDKFQDVRRAEPPVDDRLHVSPT